MTTRPRCATVPDIVETAARCFGDRTAVEGGRQDGAREPLTYAELAGLVRGGARVLHEAGLHPGDRVLVMLAPQSRYLPALLAVLAAGAVAVPLPPDLTPQMLAGVARHVDATLAIVAGDGASPPSVRRVSVQRLLRFSDAPMPPPAPHAPALLASTSGTTEGPRAVTLTHANLATNVEALLARRAADEQDVLLSMLPPWHLFELVAGQLAPLACGARIVYAPTLLPNRLIELLPGKGISRALVVPALLDCLYLELVDVLCAAAVITDRPRRQSLGETAGQLRDTLTPAQRGRIRDGVRERVGPRFREIVVGGAAVDPAWRDLCSLLGFELDVGYGLTEAGPVVSQGMASDCPPGSVGRPLPGTEVRIADDGEILVRSPSVMLGYYQDAPATSRTLVDGWLHTGDRGHLDEDGFLFVTGRSKETIVRADGTTVHPEEIEPHYRDPSFAELCVVAMPGPHGNDLPVLVVVASEESIDDATLTAAFRRCRAAAPERCRVTGMRRSPGPLPRTATGKIRRRVLAESLAREASA